MEPEKLRTIRLPASCFFPEIGRLEGRKENFLSSCGIHFLTNNRLDLPESPDSHGQIRIHPTGKFSNKPCTEHQPVADDLRFGRFFMESLDRVA
jgi:hypothetical protein